MDVVTGAYGYTGRYLARHLLDEGHTVRTLSGNPSRRPDPFDGRVEAHPFSFDDPPRLLESLSGADTLYNTESCARRDRSHSRSVRSSAASCATS